MAISPGELFDSKSDAKLAFAEKAVDDKLLVTFFNIYSNVIEVDLSGVLPFKLQDFEIQILTGRYIKLGWHVKVSGNIIKFSKYAFNL
jgi:hypothetical protein